MPTQTISALVVGGKATAGPPLGPALGQLKLNVKNVINSINDKTQNYSGMNVPITIKVDTETKKYDIEVSTPQTSVLLKKEANLEKGSGTAGQEPVGNVEFSSIVKIAKMKSDVLLAVDLKNSVKEILGTAISLGITVDTKHPKEIQNDVDAGKYDNQIK
ncbi:MAG: 50S ribosomal protein L11 [Candidatus Thorarchaeota archaeon]